MEGDRAVGEGLGLGAEGGRGQQGSRGGDKFLN